MAASTTPGLTPAEVAFIAEHEMVEVIPRQRLDALQLLGGSTPALIPPRRAAVPLWLALLLKRQQRANISAPAWLSTDVLSRILELETQLGAEGGFTRSTTGPAPPSSSLTSSSSTNMTTHVVSAPFIPLSSASHATISTQPTNGVAASDPSDYVEDSSLVGRGTPGSSLPYHWLEIAHLILASAADDVPDADGVRRLVRDLREARAAKVREAIVPALNAGRGVKVSGIGALEVAEHRQFVTGVMDGLRRIGASKEAGRREREEEEGMRRGGGGGSGRRDGGGGRGEDEEDSDDDMGL